jgi:hypothetical protein
VHRKFAHIKDLIHVTLIEVWSHSLFLNDFDITFVTFLHSSWSLFDMLLKLRAAGYLMICLCKMLHPIQGGSQPVVRMEWTYACCFLLWSCELVNFHGCKGRDIMIFLSMIRLLLTHTSVLGM